MLDRFTTTTDHLSNHTHIRPVLGKYEIGRVSNYEFPRYKEDTRGFYKALCQRVGAYFQENKINPKASFCRLCSVIYVGVRY